jgi:hypothetical protein
VPKLFSIRWTRCSYHRIYSPTKTCTMLIRACLHFIACQSIWLTPILQSRAHNIIIYSPLFTPAYRYTRYRYSYRKNGSLSPSNVKEWTKSLFKRLCPFINNCPNRDQTTTITKKVKPLPKEWTNILHVFGCLSFWSLCIAVHLLHLERLGLVYIAIWTDEVQYLREVIAPPSSLPPLISDVNYRAQFFVSR